MRAIKNRKLKWTHKDGRVVYYPIAEATEDLIFLVTERDISKAHGLKGYADPNCCVAACAVRRQFTEAIIQRDTAYTHQVRDGVIYAVRYRFGSSLRAAVAAFDSGRPFPTGNYKLLAPSPSQTLDGKLKYKYKKPKTKRKVRKHTKFSARGRVTPLSY